MNIMTKGSEERMADYPINSLFLDRWSPRAMSGEEIPLAELLVLLREISSNSPNVYTSGWAGDEIF
jgi:hypothetical protein